MPQMITVPTCRDCRFWGPEEQIIDRGRGAERFKPCHSPAVVCHQAHKAEKSVARIFTRGAYKPPFLFTPAGHGCALGEVGKPETPETDEADG